MLTLVVLETDGAVKTPADVMEPASVIHVTAELKEPVPVSVAVHWLVAPDTAGVGVQLTMTPLTVEEPEPPQAANNSMVAATATRNAHLVTGCLYCR
jgi:hypothetical protein